MTSALHYSTVCLCDILTGVFFYIHAVLFSQSGVWKVSVVSTLKVKNYHFGVF